MSDWSAAWPMSFAIEPVSKPWLGLGLSCEAAGELEDGGPVDHGGVVFGAFVVAGAASSAADPGVGALDDPAAG